MPKPPLEYPTKLLASTATAIFAARKKNTEPDAAAFNAAAKDAIRLLGACWAEAERHKQQVLEEERNIARTPYNAAIRKITNLGPKPGTELFKRYLLTRASECLMLKNSVDDDAGIPELRKLEEEEAGSISKIVDQWKVVGIATKDIDEYAEGVALLLKRETSEKRRANGIKGAQKKKEAQEKARAKKK